VAAGKLSRHGVVAGLWAVVPGSFELVVGTAAAAAARAFAGQDVFDLLRQNIIW